MVAEFVDTGDDVSLGDLLDCLASAGLVLGREPDVAAQAYSEYIFPSDEPVT